MENPFLEGLGKEFRYSREIYEIKKHVTNYPRMINTLGNIMNGGEKGEFVTSHSMTDGGFVIANVTQSGAGSSSTGSVYLYYTYSPNRQLNDLDEVRWEKVDMTLINSFTGEDEYISDVAVSAPVGNQISYFVQIETDMTAGEASWQQRSSSLIKIEDELPYLSCAVEDYECDPTKICYSEYFL